MSQANSTILVIGATGAMGSKVIEQLLADSENQWRIRAFTRNVNSDRAQALVKLSSRIEFSKVTPTMLKTSKPQCKECTEFIVIPICGGH